MDNAEFLRARVAAGLQKILYDNNDCLFSCNPTDTMRDLERIRERLGYGDLPAEAMRGTFYATAELSHYITFSGYEEPEDDALEIVHRQDHLLMEYVTSMARAMLGDHPFDVLKVRFKEAYFGNMCVHHGCEITFRVAPEKLDKLNN